jgi:hypothetical protein
VDLGEGGPQIGQDTEQELLRVRHLRHPLRRPAHPLDEVAEREGGQGRPLRQQAPGEVEHRSLVERRGGGVRWLADVGQDLGLQHPAAFRTGGEAGEGEERVDLGSEVQEAGHPPQQLAEEARTSA